MLEAEQAKKLLLTDAGAAVAADTPARAVARKNVAATVTMRLRNDFAWALLSTSPAGGVSEILIGFSSVEAHVRSLLVNPPSSVPRISAGFNPSWKMAGCFRWWVSHNHPTDVDKLPGYLNLM